MGSEYDLLLRRLNLRVKSVLETSTILNISSLNIRFQIYHLLVLKMMIKLKLKI